MILYKRVTLTVLLANIYSVLAMFQALFCAFHSYISLYSHNTHMRYLLLLSPLLRWGTKAWRFKKLTRGHTQISVRSRIPTQAFWLQSSISYSPLPLRWQEVDRTRHTAGTVCSRSPRLHSKVSLQIWQVLSVGIGDPLKGDFNVSDNRGGSSGM